LCKGAVFKFKNTFLRAFYNLVLPLLLLKINKYEKIIALSIFSFAFVYGFTQNCDNIMVNLKRGTVNKLKLTASQDGVKAALP
jgi:hypothetical protein